MKIILDIKSQYIDAPTILITHLSNEQIKKIRKHQKYIEKHNLLRLEIIDFEPGWYKSDYSADDFEDPWVSNYSLNLSPHSVDIPTLCITSESIYWTANSNDEDPANYLETDEYRLPDANENSLPDRSN